MLSIGIYTYSTNPRGSVVHSAALAEALHAAGHDTTLYALAKPEATFYRPLACPLVLLPAAEAPADVDALVRQRVGELRAGLRAVGRRHDVHHAQDCLAASALLADRSSRAAPLVRTVHHVEHYASPYLTQCQARSILEADVVLSVSRHTQLRVRQEFGRHSALVSNGVDASRFRTLVKATIERCMSTVGASGDDTLVLSVGGVEPRKNTLLALVAFAHAIERNPSLRWVIVGAHGIWDHCGYVAAFESALARLPQSVRDRVVRVGSVAEADLAALYQLSDIHLCVSKEEGFGLSVLESMAAGAAVVAPDRPPFTEYLDTSCARLVTATSVEHVADALVELAGDPNLLGRLAAAGRARARLWPWSKSATEHVALYEGAAARPRTEADPKPGEFMPADRGTMRSTHA